MTANKHTPGEWAALTFADEKFVEIRAGGGYRIIAHVFLDNGNREANARLIAAAPTQHEEMLRYLPVIERAEANPELWAQLTEGTGIATANGYRAAIEKATGGAA